MSPRQRLPAYPASATFASRLLSLAILGSGLSYGIANADDRDDSEIWGRDGLIATLPAVGEPDVTVFREAVMRASDLPVIRSTPFTCRIREERFICDGSPTRMRLCEFAQSIESQCVILSRFASEESPLVYRSEPLSRDQVQPLAAWRQEAEQATLEGPGFSVGGRLEPTSLDDRWQMDVWFRNSGASGANRADSRSVDAAFYSLTDSRFWYIPSWTFDNGLPELVRVLDGDKRVTYWWRIPSARFAIHRRRHSEDVNVPVPNFMEIVGRLTLIKPSFAIERQERQVLATPGTRFIFPTPASPGMRSTAI